MFLDDAQADTERSPALAEPIVKRCGCGAAYTAPEWRALRLVGNQQVNEDEFIELRNCASCDSTISIELPWAELETWP